MVNGAVFGLSKSSLKLHTYFNSFFGSLVECSDICNLIGDGDDGP